MLRRVNNVCVIYSILVVPKKGRNQRIFLHVGVELVLVVSVLETTLSSSILSCNQSKNGLYSPSFFLTSHMWNVSSGSVIDVLQASPWTQIGSLLRCMFPRQGDTFYLRVRTACTCMNHFKNEKCAPGSAGSCVPSERAGWRRVKKFTPEVWF